MARAGGEPRRAEGDSVGARGDATEIGKRGRFHKQAAFERGFARKRDPFQKQAAFKSSAFTFLHVLQR